MGVGSSRNDNKKESMVLAAKMGLWDQVWEILDKNKHFVNFIPEYRSWGILHQACYWENEEAIRKILSTPGCNPDLETKDGLRAIQITKKPHLQNIIAAAQGIPNTYVQEVDPISFPEMDGADATIIVEISSALENRNMSRVIRILDTHQHLVNVVSPVTGLAPLHQAVLLRDFEAVTRILSYSSCNAEVKTIEAPENRHEVGKTAEQLSDSEEVKTVIRRHILKNDQNEWDPEKLIELAAKKGEWDRVWRILEKFPYLVNCIPENKSWGILHYACYWEDERAIRKILSFPWCDPNLVTKDGLQAIEITKKPRLQSLIKVSMENSIDNLFKETQANDAPKINIIESALEQGNMPEVITVLDTAQHLVNVASLLIGLAPLHQAALLRDVQTVTKILDYPASDPDVNTIEAPNNPHGAGKTAEELTDSEEVKTVISLKKQMLKQQYNCCPTFVDISESNLLLMKYVCPTIEAHKGTLCSNTFNSEQFHKFSKLIEEIFLYIRLASQLWGVAKVIISGELYKISRDISLECRKQRSEDCFYKFLIQIYTQSRASSFINSELRNQAMNSNSPPEISSYSALLNAILIVWLKSESYTGVTYRGITLTEDQFNQYSVGTEFAWLEFVSSSQNEEVAKRFLQNISQNKDNASSNRSFNCIFVIDNSLECKWSPKPIAEFSRYRNECECLYPCGAQFRVKKVDQSEQYVSIYLQLICLIDSTPLRCLFEETRARAELSKQDVDSRLDKFNTELRKLEVIVQGAIKRKSEMMKLRTNSEFKEKWKMIMAGDNAVEVFGYKCQICDTQCHELCNTSCFDGSDNEKICRFVISDDRCTVCPGKCHLSEHVVNVLPVELIQKRANQTDPDRYEFVKKDLDNLEKIPIDSSSKMHESYSGLKNAMNEMTFKIQELYFVMRKDFPLGHQQFDALNQTAQTLTEKCDRSETMFEETLNICRNNKLI